MALPVFTNPGPVPAQKNSLPVITGVVTRVRGRLPKCVDQLLQSGSSNVEQPVGEHGVE